MQKNLSATENLVGQTRSENWDSHSQMVTERVLQSVSISNCEDSVQKT
jgi:hypothetical protein